MRFVKWTLSAGAVLLVVLGVSLAAQGQRTQEPDVLAALLVEVRGLRQAMEQMAAAGPRVQLALGRLQLQEQRVNTMLRRLESLREQVTAAERKQAQAEGDAPRIQEAIRNTEANTSLPPARREEQLQQLRAEAEFMKRALATHAGEVQRLQAEHAQLEHQLATEQGRWSEINRALEELERALGKRGL